MKNKDQNLLKDMEQSEQSEQSKPSIQDTLNGIFVRFIDITIQSLISLTVSFFFIGFILIGLFKVKYSLIWILPLIIIMSVFLSPILAKIQLGDKIRIKYFKWLNKMFHIDDQV